MANVNQPTVSWLVGGEVLETEIVRGRKTFWPIKGLWARQTFRERERKVGLSSLSKGRNDKVSKTCSRLRHLPCLSYCDGTLLQSPRVVWQREFWCSAAGRGVRSLIRVPSLPHVCVCSVIGSHHLYIFTPPSFLWAFFLRIPTLQDQTTNLSRKVGNQLASDASSCIRRTAISQLPHLHILFTTLKIRDCIHEGDNLKLWRYTRQT